MFRNILIGAFRASLVTLAIALATPAQVTPAQADVFTVTDMVVDESADSADAARQAAIDKAHVLALTALYQRIVIPEDIPGALVPPALDILPLVESFEILSEKIGKKRYQATLTFHFQADAIRQRLSASGVRFAETVSRPMVMLPVFGEGASARLWEEPNPWLHAWWNRLTDPTAFVPLVTPYGELEDVAAADAPEALGGDRAALQLLAGRYGAADALVAQLILSGDPEAGGASFVINVKRYGSTPGKADFSLNVAQEAGESAEALYARAASELAARIEVDWKRANAVYFGTEQNLAVSVTIAGLQDWLVVKRTLEGLPLVKELQVLSLSQSLASIVIHYRGTTDQLARALAQYDLLLTQGVAGWELRVAAVTGGQLQPKALEAPPPAPAAEPSPTPTPTP